MNISVPGRMKLSCIAILVLLLIGMKLSGQVNIGYSNSHPDRSFCEFSNLQFFESPLDTSKADTTLTKLHSPKKAAIMSALLPGLGQVYNKKYWKLGIIYPIMGGVVYGFAYNHNYFKYYRDALRIRYDGDSTTIDPLSLYPDDRLVTMKNYYQRYRDLCVIGFAAVYVLQIIDAAVDAHLFYFDVGPDLSMNWSPLYMPDQYGPVAGLNLKLTFQ